MSPSLQSIRNISSFDPDTRFIDGFVSCEEAADEAGATAALLTRLVLNLRNFTKREPMIDQAHPARLVRQMISARRLRGRLFDADLFGDPAWDLLLELYGAELEQRRISVSELYTNAGVPPTTGIRWISILVNRGLVVRRPDPLDSRRIFLNLTPVSEQILREYFGRISR